MNEKPLLDAKVTPPPVSQHSQHTNSPITFQRSRSRSQNRDMSINPFFNFLKDFKDTNGNTIKSAKELARVAGERWRTMSDADKSPYVNAANAAKNKNPPKTEMKPKEAKIDKARKKVIPKRVCSRCGHREGSPVVPQVKVATRNKWRRKRGAEYSRREPRDVDADDDDGDADDGDDGDGRDTDDSRSRSRSRSDSGSKSRTSGASDSSATFY